MIHTINFEFLLGISILFLIGFNYHLEKSKRSNALLSRPYGT
jgi:hypothetical protein